MAEAEEDAVEGKTYNVIIIGGGIAGLSAANHLVKNNLNDFILLEARNRLGGRIFALETDGLNFEVGANWIHGVLGNPMYEIAFANGLVDIVQVPKPHKVIAVTEEGKQIQFHILQETYEAYMCFLHRCEEYFLCQYLPPEGIDSVGEHIELEIELYLEKIEDSDEQILKRRLFDCLLKRETCITGCDSMTEIDLMELGSYAELQGGNIVLPSGYSSILKPITKDIPPEKILMDHAVSEIRWDCGCANNNNESDSDSDQTVIESECMDNVRAKSDVKSSPSIRKCNHSIIVKCENGSCFAADHVICTIPLGVLKEKADTIFSPLLPENKRESIRRLLFGTVNKIFLAYERPFLHPEISEIMLVWNHESTGKDEISDSWYKKIYSFSKVTETVLLGWISGKEAEYMETLSDSVVSEKCTYVLRKFLNDPYVPNPKLCVCTHWYGQVYTRGTNTAIAVGASQCDIENLSQPLYCNASEKKPLVLFAGEHTHSNFYSTVHGAYLSGRTAAQMLVSPVEPETIVVDCPQETNDLSSWIRGISLDDPS